MKNSLQFVELQIEYKWQSGRATSLNVGGASATIYVL